jgi:DNA-directed RNA polymerase subunit L
VCHIDADTSIIYQNTGLMHNELLKQRLLCIPVHIGYAHIHEFCNDYEVHIDVKNTTNQILYITTKDFIIKNKKTKEIVANTAQQTIFPIDMISNDYIDFAKLQSGQHIHIVCSFLISNALVNGAFNAVSLCTFSNTINYAAVDINWKKEEDTLLSNGTTVDEMEFIKKNYYILDAQRECISNSYEFSLECILYSNREIIKIACTILLDKLQHYIMTNKEENDVQELQNNPFFTISMSEVVMENSYDITLINESYTLGCIFEYIIYTFYFQSHLLSYCGFVQFHPHDTNSCIRIAFKEKYNSRENIYYCHLLLSKIAKYASIIISSIQSNEL